MITALYAGSFDPFTCGHEDIARRAAKIFDKVIIGVGQHRSKTGFFPVEKRVRMIERILVDLGERVEACAFQGLLVEFARQKQIKVVVRGLRAHVDFDNEFALALANRDAAPELETLFLVPDVRHQFVSSSLVREIASHGGDLSRYVHPVVLEAFEAMARAKTFKRHLALDLSVTAFPFENPEYRALHEDLAYHFPYPAIALPVVQRSGLDTGALFWGLPAEELWHEILKMTSSRGLLRALVNFAQETLQ